MPRNHHLTVHRKPAVFSRPRTRMRTPSSPPPCAFSLQFSRRYASLQSSSERAADYAACRAGGCSPHRVPPTSQRVHGDRTRETSAHCSADRPPKRTRTDRRLDRESLGAPPPPSNAHVHACRPPPPEPHASWVQLLLSKRKLHLVKFLLRKHAHSPPRSSSDAASPQCRSVAPLPVARSWLPSVSSGPRD